MNIRDSVTEAWEREDRIYKLTSSQKYYNQYILLLKCNKIILNLHIFSPHVPVGIPQNEYKNSYESSIILAAINKINKQP